MEVSSSLNNFTAKKIILETYISFPPLKINHIIEKKFFFFVIQFIQVLRLNSMYIRASENLITWCRRTKYFKVYLQNRTQLIRYNNKFVTRNLWKITSLIFLCLHDYKFRIIFFAFQNVSFEQTSSYKQNNRKKEKKREENC